MNIILCSKQNETTHYKNNSWTILDDLLRFESSTVIAKQTLKPPQRKLGYGCRSRLHWYWSLVAPVRMFQEYVCDHSERLLLCDQSMVCYYHIYMMFCSSMSSTEFAHSVIFSTIQGVSSQGSRAPFVPIVPIIRSTSTTSTSGSEAIREALVGWRCYPRASNGSQNKPYEINDRIVKRLHAWHNLF